MTGFALLIGVFPPAFIVFMCLSALAFNLFVFPHISGRFFEREAELKKGYALGMLVYPASLLILSLCFGNQFYMGMAWMVMGFGDGFAGLIGSRYPKPRLSWNKKKSWAGLLSFVFFGFFAALTFYFWYDYMVSTKLDLEMSFWVFFLILFGVIVAGIFESFEGWIDDNIVVPFSFALILYYGHSGINEVLINSFQELFTQQYIYVLFSVLFAALAFLSKKMDWKGAVAGVFIAIALLAAEGVFAFLLLGVFFATGTLASSYQKSLKKKRNLPGSKEKTRSWQNAFANAGPAVLFAILSMLYPDASEQYIVMMAASLAAATADTLSSELGMVTGKKFYNILNFQETKAGPDGSVSLSGLFFGLIGAVLIALFSIPIFPMWPVLLVIVFCGFMGTIFDSLLGAGPEHARLMNNHTVNFTSCLLAGVLAGFIIHFLSPLVF